MAGNNVLVIGNLTGYERLPDILELSALFEGVDVLFYEEGAVVGEWAARMAEYLQKDARPITLKPDTLRYCGMLLILCDELTDELLEVYGNAAAYDIRRVIYGVREKLALI
ncbi:hypothetical protein LJC27_00565 [Christensenellaceae bacterium OttesenSCG-928-M15]|nr:hypothetical protein [Christensenellaceae bacterium OttesenSCG-928-M15]